MLKQKINTSYLFINQLLKVSVIYKVNFLTNIFV